MGLGAEADGTGRDDGTSGDDGTGDAGADGKGADDVNVMGDLTDGDEDLIGCTRVATKASSGFRDDGGVLITGDGGPGV